MGTLWSAVTELGISVDSLLAEASSDGSVERSGSGSPSFTPVRRQGQRKRIRLAGGVTWERLSSGPEPTVDFILETYEPGAVSSPDRAMHRHGGREYLYIVSGRLGMAIDFDEYELGPGDSMSYSSERPHRGWTIGNRPAVVIWVMVHPASQSDRAPSQAESGAGAPDH